MRADHFPGGSPPRVWGQPPPLAPRSASARFTPTRVGTTRSRTSTCGSGRVHPHACGDNAAVPTSTNVNVGSPPRVWGQLGSRSVFMGRFRFTPTRVGTTSTGPRASHPVPVHPHACGDNPLDLAPHVRRDGSPPRVWGQLENQHAMTANGRFTPTRVGTTVRKTGDRASRSVHPHACGDNRVTIAHELAHGGSPPRVWGQLVRWGYGALGLRFTPTRVGTTWHGHGTSSRVSVHPHACGDNDRMAATSSAVGGSPPRVWGQRLWAALGGSGRRFTPTRVGTTVAGGTGRGTAPVHPHACGDNGPRRKRRDLLPGSPPRVWGQRRGSCGPCPPPRFTPTRVGTTLQTGDRASSFAVHPHACGDNRFGVIGPSGRTGSPPRVWGQLRCSAANCRGDRFTPTRVGTTARRQGSQRPWSVHPHACGDNCRPPLEEDLSVGSPPRVWGQRALEEMFARYERFTPTRVGTTPSRRTGAAASPVHPHACGDNVSFPHIAQRFYGSPPRVWGQRHLCLDRLRLVRFTPTRVGTTG